MAVRRVRLPSDSLLPEAGLQPFDQAAEEVVREVGGPCEEGGIGAEIPFQSLAALFGHEALAAVVEEGVGEGVAAEAGGLEEALDVGDVIGEGAGGVQERAEREFGEADGRLGAAGVADLVDEGGEALEVVLEAVGLVERAPGGGEHGVLAHRAMTRRDLEGETRACATMPLF